MRLIFPVVLALTACGSATTTDPDAAQAGDASADASSIPPVTTCPPESVTMGSAFPFSICDTATGSPRFVTVEECASRNGLDAGTYRGGNSTHPEVNRCMPRILLLQRDIR